MNEALRLALTEISTSSNPQVVLTALCDPLTIAETFDTLALPPTSFISMSYLHTPLFPDLVRGLCHRLWDNFIQMGNGNALRLLSEDDLEERSDNLVVQRAIEALVPLSKKGDPQLALLIDAYCTDGCTPAERRDLGLSRALDRQDQLDLLSILMREQVWPRRLLQRGTFQGMKYPPFIMHLDHVERLVHCAPLDVAQFTSALCYLIDAMGERFTLWLNAVGDTPVLLQEIEQAICPHFVGYPLHNLLLIDQEKHEL
ncbi:hypothetical protein KDA_76540 [Dictyobacter alpinus]|uniref:Uncharacterized protein n=1 Tax=Dictyobacter alpinus TaxID=2014873 RepID=A0A402BLI9_9CHLR|nr:hypothetical protein [Dictyobacter alpinus]GCE32170.1 hypothetical protein KDA_76540 [Dictyobacter alpinus]